MALLAFAALLAAAGTYVTIMAMRFRQGRAEHLRHQPYQMSLWPAARRNIAYGLVPIAGILFLTAASMAAQIAGVRGPLASAVYLLLMLVALVALVVLMVTRPRWLGPPDMRGDRASAATGLGSDDEPPRPISEMTGQELADWARGDPEKLRRLIRRRRQWF
jgi:hypothetical protein